MFFGVKQVNTQHKVTSPQILISSPKYILCLDIIILVIEMLRNIGFLENGSFVLFSISRGIWCSQLEEVSHEFLMYGLYTGKNREIISG